MEYAPWSHSKAETASQCPRKFYLTYVQKVKTGKSNSDALVGKAVHTILEFMLAGRNWEVAYGAAVDKHALTTDELERVEDFKVPVHEFMAKLARYKERHDIGNDIWIEKKLAVNLDGNPVKFFDSSAFFRGIVDLAMFPRKQKHIVILDHKTGKHRALRHYRQQFNSYLILTKAAVPDLVQSSTGIHWAKSATVEVDPTSYDVQTIEPYFEQLISWLNDCTQSTVNFGETKRGPLCPWCDYQDSCPAFDQGSIAEHATLKEEDGEAPRTNT
jgi:putative RecB family exonuclease